MIVRGVYRDIPENTMFKADFVVSVHKEGGYKDGAGWGGNDIFYAVFRTGEASDIEVVTITSSGWWRNTCRLNITVGNWNSVSFHWQQSIRLLQKQQSV